MYNEHSNFRGRFAEFGHRFARRSRQEGLSGDAPERRHDHGHGGHHHTLGRHGRHGLGRFFAHGDLRLVVLNLIDQKPSHGYEIIKAIEERVGGAYSPSPGVIYPTLTHLEELGYVSVTTTAESSKKLYAMTAEGRSYLRANRKTLDELFSRMDETGRSHRSGAAPPIVRAMENLKLALRLRLTSGPLGEEQVNAVAAAIDAAAVAVEKV